MAVTSHVYPTALSVWAPGSATVATCLNPTTDSFSAGLTTTAASTWTATQWAYTYVSTILASGTGPYTEVATGGGYTSGYANRQSLTTLTWGITGTLNVLMWTCTSPSPISFGASTTITALSMFIYDKTGHSASADTNAWAVWISDFGGSVSSTSGAFTYTVAASPNGLAYWTAS